MKKIFAVLLIILALSLFISAHAGRNSLKEFKSNSGVECLWKLQGGYHETGGGLSCNWEKWNKETNYRSITR